MNTSMINKIQKSKVLAGQPERVTLHTLNMQFQGDNNSYHLALGPDGWSCSCPGYQKYHICPHIMTIEKLFKPMLKRAPLPYAAGQNIVSDVEKAKRYMDETHRITIMNFTAMIEGKNRDHQVSYDEGTWHSDSSYFDAQGVDAYIMAMERLFKGMVQPAITNQPDVKVD